MTDGRARLGIALREQAILSGESVASEEAARIAKLLQLSAGEILIKQDGVDNDLYFVLAGNFRVFVNGREVATRRLGQHLGEMAIIDPTARRSATVIASEASLVAHITEAEFIGLADRHPHIWRMLARQLSRRLDERRQFHSEPNAKPILFVGSSSEQVSISNAVVALLPVDLVATTLWTTGVFGASSFPIDDLEVQIKSADFALLVAGSDDEVTSRGKVSSAPRDNVIFELGLFMGALSRRRTFVLVPKGVAIKLPTDLLGINHLRFDPNAKDMNEAVGEAVAELCTIIQHRGSK